MKLKQYMTEAPQMDVPSDIEKIVSKHYEEIAKEVAAKAKSWLNNRPHGVDRVKELRVLLGTLEDRYGRAEWISRIRVWG